MSDSTLGSDCARPIAARIASWAVGLDFGRIAPEVVEKSKLHLLDQIGAQVSCVGLVAPRVALDYATRYGRAGVASVLGTSVKLDPESAGFVNGTSGSAFEIDDYGYGAFAHPGCVVMPGVLSVGEETGVSGQDALTAMAAGSEFVIRLALAGMPSMLLERGFHETAAHGVFAVALTTAMLKKFDVITATNALAIAGSHASGTTEYAQSGGEIKRVHGGIGVAGGIRSARLAELGLTGPPTILEGRRGFLQAFSNSYDPTVLVEDLGTRWHFLERGAIKPYASVGVIHQHFAAYDKMIATGLFTGDQVDSILMGCDPMTLSHAGHIGSKPHDMVGAQFSAEFGMAMRVVLGRNDMAAYAEMADSGFSDPAVLEMAGRITLVADDEAAAGFPRKWLGRTTVTLKDGSTYSETGYALGSPLNPLGREGIEAKNRALLTPILGEAVTDEVIQTVMTLDELSDVNDLTRLLAAN